MNNFIRHVYFYWANINTYIYLIRNSLVNLVLLSMSVNIVCMYNKIYHTIYIQFNLI